MTRRGFGLLTPVLLLLTGISIALSAQGTAPPPGVVAGNFTTHGPGYFKNREEAALLIDHYFALDPTTLQPSLNAEFFRIGAPPYTYTWRRTNATETVGKGKKAEQVNSGVAAIVQALASPGPPGALPSTATNPTDMGTAGILGIQALTLKLNQGFSEVFVTPVTGFSGLSLVDVDGVELDGSVLTPAQVDTLNGQATLQIREATDVPLGGGPLPYGLSFGQLTDLIDLLNGSFEDGEPSEFAQAHLYQPYVTSAAFAGKRPSTVSVFASKPTYNTFEGEVVSVGTGCVSSDYVSFPAGRIALIERGGGCSFYQKVSAAKAAFAIAAIVFNSLPEVGGPCPAVPTPGSGRCEALVGMGVIPPFVPISIPAAFVQRSTGLALRSHAPVHAFVQQ